MMPIKRLKTLTVALFTALSLWTAPALAAGTLPLAMAQQIDINGKPLANCQVTFYVAGTVGTLQNVYADFGLTTQIGNPLTCDQAGRVPMFWLADGLIHVRMTDSFGTPVIDTTMQVLGPSSGGGGGGSTIDPTTIFATGDLKWRLDKAPLSGWVRINGLTIGSATSGATERANADTLPLYTFLWTTFSQVSGNQACPVVGGLGASALADFNANKPLTLKDARASALFALDDLGNAPLGGFAGIPFSIGTPIVVGAQGGSNSTTLSLAQLPPGITSSGSNTINVSGSNSFTATGTNTINASGSNTISVTSAFSDWVRLGGTVLFGGVQNGVGGGIDFNSSPTTAASTSSGSNSISVSGSNTINVAGSVSINSTGSNAIAVTSNNTGGAAFPSIPKFLLGTLYWKL